MQDFYNSLVETSIPQDAYQQSLVQLCDASLVQVQSGDEYLAWLPW